MNDINIADSNMNLQEDNTIMYVEHCSEVRRFAYEIVSLCSSFDTLSGCYKMHITDVPDFEIFELSALLMREDSAYAAEATGPDNDQYESKMLPALIRYLSDVTDKDNEIEFLSEWNAGIAHYQEKMMSLVLSEAIDRYNINLGYTEKE